MKFRLALTSGFFALTAACASVVASSPATLDKSLTSFAGAKIELVQQGGFAGLAIRKAVKHDDRSFVATTRRICGANCAAPTDSASGLLTVGATDSLFTAILAQNPFALKDDYGVTKSGADMFAYDVRLTIDGKSKS